MEVRVMCEADACDAKVVDVGSETKGEDKGEYQEDKGGKGGEVHDIRALQKTGNSLVRSANGRINKLDGALDEQRTRDRGPKT